MNYAGQILGTLLTQELPRDLHAFGRGLADAHAKRAQLLAQEEAPKLTGALARTTEIVKRGNDQREFIRIVQPTKRYAQYVHEGTGLFGPFQRRITPKFKRAMRWIAGGQVVFARSTKGQRPNPFLDRAYKRLLVESDALTDRLWRAV